jgi:hypothetical protein
MNVICSKHVPSYHKTDIFVLREFIPLHALTHYRGVVHFHIFYELVCHITKQTFLDFDSSQYVNLLLLFAMMFNKHKSYYKRQLLLRELISFQLLLRFSVGMVRELADSTRDVTCY